MYQNAAFCATSSPRNSRRGPNPPFRGLQIKHPLCIVIRCPALGQRGWCKGYCKKCAPKNGRSRPVEVQKQKKVKVKNEVKRMAETAGAEKQEPKVMAEPSKKRLAKIGDKKKSKANPDEGTDLNENGDEQDLEDRASEVSDSKANADEDGPVARPGGPLPGPAVPLPGPAVPSQRYY